jgi:transcription elongation factor GreA
MDDADDKNDCEYKLVGTAESDPKNSKISNESPVGRALIGHKKNEIVEVAAPGGKIRLKIIKISL